MKILFTLYVNSLKKFVPWKPVSELFYTSNTLSISLCKSVQIRHWYRSFHNRKRRYSTRKSCMKTRPLDERQELHTWLHQTKEQNPTTSKHWFKFTYSYFPLKFACQTSTVVVVVVVIIGLFLSVHVFFLARFLIDRCQIVTDICTKNVSNFVWKPFKSPFSLHK